MEYDGVFRKKYVMTTDGPVSSELIHQQQRHITVVPLSHTHTVTYRETTTAERLLI